MIEQIVKDYTKHLYEDPRDIIEKLNYFRSLSAKGLDTLTVSEISELKKEFSKFFKS